MHAYSFCMIEVPQVISWLRQVWVLHGCKHRAWFKEYFIDLTPMNTLDSCVHWIHSGFDLVTNMYFLGSRSTGEKHISLLDWEAGWGMMNVVHFLSDCTWRKMQRETVLRFKIVTPNFFLHKAFLKYFEPLSFIPVKISPNPFNAFHVISLWDKGVLLH